MNFFNKTLVLSFILFLLSCSKNKDPNLRLDTYIVPEVSFRNVFSNEVEVLDTSSLVFRFNEMPNSCISCFELTTYAMNEVLFQGKDIDENIFIIVNDQHAERLIGNLDFIRFFPKLKTRLFVNDQGQFEILDDLIPGYASLFFLNNKREVKEVFFPSIENPELVQQYLENVIIRTQMVEE